MNNNEISVCQFKSITCQSSNILDRGWEYSPFLYPPPPPSNFISFSLLLDSLYVNSIPFLLNVLNVKTDIQICVSDPSLEYCSYITYEIKKI